MDHDTATSPAISVPVLSRSSARNSTLSPTTSVVSAGASVTLATGAGGPTTWTSNESDTAPLVALNVTHPTCFPVMNTTDELAVPESPVIAAIVVSDNAHVTTGLVTGLPAESHTAAP